jgi:hypothetical protein
MVESIIAYSLSASLARYLKIRVRTHPFYAPSRLSGLDIMVVRIDRIHISEHLVLVA